MEHRNQKIQSILIMLAESSACPSTPLFPVVSLLRETKKSGETEKEIDCS